VLVEAKAFATEYLGAPYHQPSVPANKDSPMLLVKPVAAAGADLVVLYNNCRPLLAVLSAAVNKDSPMLLVKPVAAAGADLVVL
jgi:hypothetical protein